MTIFDSSATILFPDGNRFRIDSLSSSDYYPVGNNQFLAEVTVFSYGAYFVGVGVVDGLCSVSVKSFPYSICVVRVIGVSLDIFNIERADLLFLFNKDKSIPSIEDIKMYF